MVKNENAPHDFGVSSYQEPLLAELRVTYLIHGRCSGVDMDALRKLSEECCALKNDRASGRISPEKCADRIFKLTKRLLPKECPEDWIQSIP